MVRPEGFEPPTNGFGSHYSIRLSYGRILKNRRTTGGPGWASQRHEAVRTGILSVNAAQVCPLGRNSASGAGAGALAVSFAHGLRTF